MTDPNSSPDVSRANDTHGVAAAHGTPSKYESVSEKAGLSLYQSVRRLLQALDHNSNALRKKIGLTLPHVLCLQVITHHGPVTPTGVANQVNMSASTVVGLLDDLERKILIERQRDQRDRRLVNITATDSGRQLSAENPVSIESILLDGMARTSRSERSAASRALHGFVQKLDDLRP
jgi:DNA-binding MarR family transcriptional regulator